VAAAGRAGSQGNDIGTASVRHPQSIFTPLERMIDLRQSIAVKCK